MTREKALDLLKENLENKNLQKHCLAVEAGMRHFAKYFDEDENLWGLAGLLHDLDYEETKDNFEKHGIRTAEMLEELDDVDGKIIYAIKAHPGHVEAKSRMDKVLYALDPLTGLVIAATLMHPEKKISALDKNFLLRRFKDKRFAAGANRDQIKACKEFDMELEDFLEHTIEAMASIEKKLGF
ncbi:MAG: HDIG domain-containing protein [Candidatus Cloacimonetes bacterium]|nr:HDIG domain-containing protein [Candidatus Cloacimonadota bacterium]MBS3767522.1 HDIG domain-containing protein [Candidatus Cloacimonadota bacterium]